MPTPFSGSCASGAIRYECSAAPLLSLNCYCRDCQRATGSAFTSALVVPTDALQVTQGTPKYHTTKADSGNSTSRRFCSECGSLLLVKVSVVPTTISIAAASLDDPSWHKPRVDFFEEVAAPTALCLRLQQRGEGYGVGAARSGARLRMGGYVAATGARDRLTAARRS
jgi:hypothetical protein